MYRIHFDALISMPYGRELFLQVRQQTPVVGWIGKELLKRLDIHLRRSGAHGPRIQFSSKANFGRTSFESLGFSPLQSMEGA